MEGATTTIQQTSGPEPGMDKVVDSALGLLRQQDVASYKEMTDRIADGSTVLFVGAGPSTPLCGSWDRLIFDLLTEARLVTRKETPFETVDRCRNVLGRKRYGEVLLKRFDLDRRSRSEDIHVSMALAPFDSYVTTNYDRCIEEAFGTAQRCHGAVYSYPKSISAADLGQRAIFHLHGCIEGTNQDPSKVCVVLGEEDYREAYGPQGDLADFLDQLLVRSARTVVFCGYSFEDHNVVFESLRRGSERIRVQIEKRGEAVAELSPRVHYVLLDVPTYPDLTYRAVNVREREKQLEGVVSGCVPVVRFVPVLYADPHPDSQEKSHMFLRSIFQGVARVKTNAVQGPPQNQEYPSAAHP